MQLNLKIALIVAIPYYVATQIKIKHANQTEFIYRETFSKYKVDFEKHYENKTEEDRGFKNFENNLVRINDLNKKLAKDTNNTKLYVVNKHADVDSEEFNEHYGFKLKPYDEINAKEALRSQLDDTRSIKDAQLYDLLNADQLYEQYQTQFNKTNSTKRSKRTRAIQYYRFVKTLVEINNNNMEGKPLRTLDDKADVVKKPYEYY